MLSGREVRSNSASMNNNGETQSLSVKDTVDFVWGLGC